MKKLITILFMFSFVWANAQRTFQPTESYAFTLDKQWHTGIGGVLGISLFAGFYNHTQDAKFSRRAARIFSGFPILGKEIADGLAGKPVSLADILYGYIGVEAGAELGYLIVKWKKKRQAKKIKKKFDINENISYSLDNEIFNKVSLSNDLNINKSINLN